MVIPKNKTQAKKMIVDLNKQIKIAHTIIKASKVQKEVELAKVRKKELEKERRIITGYLIQYERGAKYDDIKVWWVRT